QQHLKDSWAKVSTAPKNLKQELAKSNKTHLFKKQTKKPADILDQMLTAQTLLAKQIEDAAVFGSRLQIDGSHFIPAAAHSGTVTGVSAGGINFSVGNVDHAKYFASGFSGKAILIEFALDKAKWREWKTTKSGPQQQGIGPSAP